MLPFGLRCAIAKHGVRNRQSIASHLNFEYNGGISHHDRDSEAVTVQYVLGCLRQNQVFCTAETVHASTSNLNSA